MASYPPPAPPPYGFDPKQQRRMAKEQFRMQRDAMRAQRDLYRMQQRGLRRRSLLGPLLLISIGVVLLMVRNGHISPERFLEEYSHWWPMLFVFAGAVVLLEWGFDQFMVSLHPDAPPMGRRGVGGGVIFLLILLSIVGAGGMAIHSHASDLLGTFSSDDQDWAQFLGEKHESDQTVDRALPAGTALTIDNAKGRCDRERRQHGRADSPVGAQRGVHAVGLRRGPQDAGSGSADCDRRRDHGGAAGGA